MSSNSSIEKICIKVSSGGTPSRKIHEYYSNDNSGHLWVKSKELLDRNIYDTEEKITDLGLENSSAKYFPENTVLLAMYGANVGQLGVIKKPATVNQAICGLTVDEEVSNFQYVFYNLLYNRNELILQAQGAAQQNLNQGTIKNFQINLPPLYTQHKIASILKVYDELIDNNTRRIQILEEMAQRIYKEWFVDFKYPGNEDDELVDSKLGMIPEGWEVTNFSSICSRIQAGGTPSRKKENYWKHGNIWWYATKELHDSFLFKSNENITNIGLQESSAKLFDPGTILMAIYSSPTVGRLGIVTEKSSCNQAALGLVSNDKIISRIYLFYTLFYLRKYFNSIAQGAAQQNISKVKVENTPAIVAKREIITAFDNKIFPIWKKIRNLIEININLLQTRDLLLPKLISGKIDVSDLDIDTSILYD